MKSLPRPEHSAIAFGPFRLVIAERLLMRDGKPVALAPKVFDTLVVLVEHRGSLVSKHELLERVWCGAFVEEGSLCTAISSLRKALGEHHYIETVTKKGYRFNAPVEDSEHPDTAVPVIPARRHIPLIWGVVAILLIGVGLADWLSGRPSPRAPLPLSKPDSSASLQARQFYRTGRHFLGKRTAEGLKRAVVQFENSSKADPSYAPAYAGLASSYALLNLYGSVPSNEIYPLAKSAARKALALNASSSDAHAAMGAVHLYYDWNWLEADAEFRQATALEPSDPTARLWLGLSLAAQGRLRESLDELNRAIELDPLSLIARAESARVLYLSGRYDEAIDAARQALELDPYFMRARIRLGEAYWMKGMLAEAIQQLRRAVEISDSDVPRATLGSAYAEAGDVASARHHLLELRNRTNATPVSPYSLAMLYAALNEPEPFFANLERAYQDRSSALIYVLVDPHFKRYHSDDRFHALLRKMKLEPDVESARSILRPAALYARNWWP